MGKTSLSVKLAQQVQEHFEWVIWRSLANAPPMGELLAEWVALVGGSAVELPDTTAAQISLLLRYLRAHRCLLVLDNCETILQGARQLPVVRGYADRALRITGNCSAGSARCPTTVAWS